MFLDNRLKFVHEPANKVIADQKWKRIKVIMRSCSSSCSAPGASTPRTRTGRAMSESRRINHGPHGRDELGSTVGPFLKYVHGMAA